MSWIASFILVNCREEGYLGKFPKHDIGLAESLLKRLNLDESICLGHANFVMALQQPGGAFGFGAYPGACVFIDRARITNAIAQPNPIVESFLDVFPNGQLLIAELDSRVNFFAYAFYQDHALSRAYAGDINNGITFEFGALQPEEVPAFEASEVENGQRWFYLHRRKLRASAAGEYLVFQMTKKFFGIPLDQLPLDIQADGSMSGLEVGLFR